MNSQMCLLIFNEPEKISDKAISLMNISVQMKNKIFLEEFDIIKD